MVCESRSLWWNSRKIATPCPANHNEPLFQKGAVRFAGLNRANTPKPPFAS